LCAALLLPSCTSSGYRDVKITSEYDDHVDFATIRTWDWLPKANAPIQDPRVHDETAHARLRRVIEAELGSRGLRRASSAPPDVWVHHTVWLMARTDLPKVDDPGDARTAGVGAGGNANPADDEGGLLIELLDGRTSKRVWIAQVRAFLTLEVSPEEKERRVRDVVRRMLEHYPPKPWQKAMARSRTD
jgi:hypothetical protein